jgi:hypothetical protein
MRGEAMSPPEKTTTLSGSCHCGNIQAQLSTHMDPASIHPRACDCSFCRKHGAAYISDPSGKLTIKQSSAGTLHRYRQGTETADFIICKNCGVLIGVTFEHESIIYGALNAGCLDDGKGLGQAVSASPQTLSRNEKISRWLHVWVPGVEFVISGT